MIHVVTIMTGPYNNYLKGQLNTLNNLFPNKEKTFTIVSDLDNQLNNYDLSNFNNIKFNWFKILDLPYTYIVSLKLYFVLKAIEQIKYNDNDLLLYCDADTLFLKKSNKFYNNLYSKFINYDLIFTIHPYYFDNHTFVYPFAHSGKTDRAHNWEIKSIDINKVVMGSLYAGKISKLKELNKDILYLQNIDLNKDISDRHIPPGSDEEYLNKIVNDHINNYRSDYIILCERYNKIFNNDKYLQYTCFVNQKYDCTIKELKRNNTNYII